MDPLESTVDGLQRSFERISPAPRVASSLRALVAEGSINPDEMVSLIRLEPLLAARVLREANLLPSRDGYASIEESVTAIGFQRMYDLIGLYAFPCADDDRYYRPDRWKRAVTCAVCMESLAEKHKLDPQQAYAIGLLHSLAGAIAEAEGDPIADESADEGGFRNRLRQFNRAGLSHALFSSWGFPRRFVDPVRFQYAPLDCQSTGKMACLLHLSKWVTGVIREIDELPDQALGPDVLVLNLLGEGEQTLWNLVADVSERLLEADAILHGGRADTAA